MQPLAVATAGGDLFAQVMAVAGLVLGSGGVLAVFTDRRKRRKETERIGAEANKLGIDGQVSISGATLEWARDFRKEAQDAKAEARQAVEDARAANQRADQCMRDRDNDRELISDLRREFDTLLNKIATCPGGSVCPIADSLTRK